MRIRKRKPIGKKTIKYIEKLYEAYSRKLFYIAKNHVKDDDLAQDVVQSVFEKALVYPEGILKVPEKEVFYFLTAITKNESFTLLKNEKNMRVLHMKMDQKEILLKILEIIICR